MGWDGSGNVDRTNGTATGESVWQEDLAAGRLVTALAHDTHDEDLADAIEKCLNIDGENAMLADLDMGGFDIQNIGSGNHDLIIESGTWTPELKSGTAAGAITDATGVTYGSRSGYYYRINDLVYIACAINVTDTGVSFLGDLILTGLPYTPASQGSGANLNEFALTLGKFVYNGSVSTSSGFDEITPVAQPLSLSNLFFGGIAFRHNYDGNTEVLDRVNSVAFEAEFSGVYYKAAG